MLKSPILCEFIRSHSCHPNVYVVLKIVGCTSQLCRHASAQTSVCAGRESSGVAIDRTSHAAALEQDQRVVPEAVGEEALAAALAGTHCAGVAHGLHPCMPLDGSKHIDSLANVEATIAPCFNGPGTANPPFYDVTQVVSQSSHSEGGGACNTDRNPTFVRASTSKVPHVNKRKRSADNIRP